MPILRDEMSCLDPYFPDYPPEFPSKKTSFCHGLVKGKMLTFQKLFMDRKAISHLPLLLNTSWSLEGAAVCIGGIPVVDTAGSWLLLALLCGGRPETSAGLSPSMQWVGVNHREQRLCRSRDCGPWVVPRDVAHGIWIAQMFLSVLHYLLFRPKRQSSTEYIQNVDKLNVDFVIAIINLPVISIQWRHQNIKCRAPKTTLKLYPQWFRGKFSYLYLSFMNGGDT